MIDKATQSYLDISYQVGFDDTALGAFDIPVSDAKTHQFFAIAGDVAPNGPSYLVYPFDEPAGDPIDLPNWITLSDVERAAQASFDATGTMLSDSDVPPERVLASNAALSGRWQRISADDARLPIRVTQSLRPVHWDLKDVAPGTYSVAAYVFSPPYNDWAARPGVVKLIDADHDAPAGDLAPIVESVFSYQGRRVSACLDVPSGTQLSAYYRVEEQPQLGWLPWLPSRPVESGMLDLCFHTDHAGLAGSVRLRVDLTAPDGTVSSLHSHDTLTWLQGNGTCAESDTLCCSFEPSQPEDAEPADAGSSGAPAPATSARPHAAGGCNIGVLGQPASGWLTLLSLGVWVARRRRD